MSERVIYLDHNATSPLDPQVLDAMLPHLREFRGNPSSRHSLGRQSRKAIDLACKQIANGINCDPKQILFTSGATEANHLAIRSFGKAKDSKSHILVNPAEHPSALEPAKLLDSSNIEVELLPLNKVGQPKGKLSDYVRPTTTLIVSQLANSETGTIQHHFHHPAVDDSLPPSVQLHCDAAQALGKVPVNFRALNVGTLSISAHKVCGPVGVGALIHSERVRILPQFVGGHQQGGFRAGTEPIALIAGLGKAVEIACQKLDANRQRLAALRDLFEEKVFASVPDVQRNGDLERRLPNTSNLSFLGANAQALVIALDLAGVCCSAGSACASGSMEPSPVLTAMGLDAALVQSAIRFSVGFATTESDIETAVSRIVNVVRLVRKAASL